jgi:AhpD family alkylhydroperoxidase
MSGRINYAQQSEGTFKALLGLEKSLANAIDKRLVDLIKIRASQLNGCLMCVDLHTKEARTHEERELRVHHLAFWRESTLFNEKEKAALEWTELLTKIPPHGVEDEDFKKISQHFSEKEISDLTLTICSINVWNRLGVAFRPTPGSLDAAYGVDKIGLK